jgi:hypothetical protein
MKSQSLLYLDAYSWESFISISVSNLFMIIRWPILVTMPLNRMTTMPIRLHHKHWSKCCSCKIKCCKLCNRLWQTCSKHKDNNQHHSPSSVTSLENSTRPSLRCCLTCKLKTIEKKLQVVQCTNRERVILVVH